MLSQFFFFFQAEDGIRDLTVTGVQTCALPIWILRNTWFDHGSFSVFLCTGRDSTGTSMVVIGFQPTRSARRHCRSPIGLVPPSVAEPDRMDTAGWRVAPRPPTPTRHRTPPRLPTTPAHH